LIDLNTFFGLEKFLADTQFADTGGLYLLHLALLVIIGGVGIFLNYLVARLSSHLVRFLAWGGRLLLTHSVIWGVVYGLLLWVIGDDISLSKHIYIYFAVLITLGIAQTHIESTVPRWAFFSATSNSGKIVQNEPVTGSKPK